MGFDPITLGIGAAYAGGKYLSNRGKKKKNEAAVKNVYDPLQAQTQGYISDIQGRLPQARERDQKLYDTILNQYTNQAGGSNSINYNTRALPTYQEFAKTGGWGSADTAGINKTIGGYDDLAAGK